jgi:hypothetical protein
VYVLDYLVALPGLAVEKAGTLTRARVSQAQTAVGPQGQPWQTAVGPQDQPWRDHYKRALPGSGPGQVPLST